MGAQVSREPPPPLPGGYTVGEQVYYTGAGETFKSGNRLVHGEQGEVVGPATLSLRGKGVAVLFSGNKGVIELHPDQVAAAATEATHSSLLGPVAPQLCPSSPSLAHPQCTVLWVHTRT